MNQATSFPRQDFDVKQTAAAMRKTLKAAFPDTKFTVRMSRGTAYGWIHVSYTDGPTVQDVQALTDQFRSQRFDGRDDAYHVVDPTLVATAGDLPVEMRYSCCGVNISRHYSDDAEAWATAAVEGHPGRWHSLNDPGDPAEPNYFATRRALAETDLTNALEG